MRRALQSAALACSVAACAGAFAAGPIYKSTGPDGRVMYSDEPAKGAVRVERIILPPPPVMSSSAGSSASSSATARSARSEARGPRAAEAIDDRLAARTQAFDRANFEVRAAAVELERAQQRLDQAMEPQAAERTGLAGGGSRLNEFYYARINALELQRAAAQRRLDAAYEQRNALRD